MNLQMYGLNESTSAGNLQRVHLLSTAILDKIAVTDDIRINGASTWCYNFLDTAQAKAAAINASIRPKWSNCYRLLQHCRS